MNRLIAICALLAVTGSVHAQGYFNFSEVPGLDEEPTVQIEISPTMLNFVSEALKATNPEATGLLAGIEGVRVLVYDISDDAREVLKFIDDVSSRLERDNWERTVYIQGEDEKVRVYVQFDDTRVTGLTVMVAHLEGNEAVFINVAGEIDPARIGQVAGALGLDEALGGLGAFTGASATSVTE